MGSSCVTLIVGGVRGTGGDSARSTRAVDDIGQNEAGQNYKRFREAERFRFWNKVLQGKNFRVGGMTHSREEGRGRGKREEGRGKREEG
jgi:hypothetical protein